MSRFDRDADRVLAFLSEGLTQLEACKRAGVPIDTFRRWVTNGRRDPSTKYGEFVAKMETASMVEKPEEAKGADDTLGPVETEVAALVAASELRGEMKLVAAEALSLARSADRLAETRGGAAATALAVTSRRLEELVERLQVPKEDHLDELKNQPHIRRLRAAIHGMPMNGRAD